MQKFALALLLGLPQVGYSDTFKVSFPEVGPFVYAVRQCGLMFTQHYYLESPGASVTARRVATISYVDRAADPRLVCDVGCAYPFELLWLGQTGSVSVFISIDRNGVVSDVEVFDSDAPGFSNAVTKIVRRWSFQPAKLDGVSVPCVEEYRFDFAIDDE